MRIRPMIQKLTLGHFKAILGPLLRVKWDSGGQLSTIIKILVCMVLNYFWAFFEVNLANSQDFNSWGYNKTLLTVKYKICTNLFANFSRARNQVAKQLLKDPILGKVSKTPRGGGVLKFADEGLVRTDQVKAGQVRTGQVRTCPVRTELLRTGQGKLE